MCTFKHLSLEENKETDKRTDKWERDRKAQRDRESKTEKKKDRERGLRRFTTGAVCVCVRIEFE